MEGMEMKRLAAFIIFAGSVCAYGAMTAKTSWTQRWPWNTKVDVDFILEGGEKCDVAVTASFTTNGVAGTFDLEKSFNVKGDFWELVPGQYNLSWDPVADGFDVSQLENFSVTVTPIEDAATVRKWLVLNIMDGTWQYASDEPDGGWAADVLYMRERMVFRRIPAGTFVAGMSDEEAAYLDADCNVSNQLYLPRRNVTISHDYYIAIFKTTFTQVNRLLSGVTYDSNYAYIGALVNYPALRGSNSVDAINWPLTKFSVKEGCIVDVLRDKFAGRFMIDLPTNAQWEKAARAGTSTYWYNGGTIDTPYSDCTNLIKAIGHTCVNPSIGEWSGVSVGSYSPNPYGLYDVVGIRPEYVLDQYMTPADAAAQTYDPVGGSASSASRVTRGTFVNKSHGLRYYTHAQYNYEGQDNTLVGQALAVRFAVHLRPPRSFGGEWK